MMRGVWRNWVSQASGGRRVLVYLLFAQAFACGGAMVDDGSASGVAAQENSTVPASKGGSPGTVAPSNGSATSSAAEPICFGKQAAAPTECTVPIELDAIGADNPQCIITVPIAANMKLNPAKVHIYFKTNGVRTEVPYAGIGAAACASASTYGGWYATNTTGGPTDIGLCECACNGARKHSFFLDVECSGIPGGTK